MPDERTRAAPMAPVFLARSASRESSSGNFAWRHTRTALQPERNAELAASAVRFAPRAVRSGAVKRDRLGSGRAGDVAR